MTSLTKKPVSPKQKIFFRVQSTRLADLFEPLNSSLAQWAEELGCWQSNRKLLSFLRKSPKPGGSQSIKFLLEIRLKSESLKPLINVLRYLVHSNWEVTDSMLTNCKNDVWTEITLQTQKSELSECHKLESIGCIKQTCNQVLRYGGQTKSLGTRFLFLLWYMFKINFYGCNKIWGAQRI